MGEKENAIISPPEEATHRTAIWRPEISTLPRNPENLTAYEP